MPTVTDAFEDDHRRLDALLERAKELFGGGELEAARRSFAQFRAGLAHHIDVEEQILFPAFEQATGMSGGPTQVMRHEHRILVSHLDQAAAAIEAGDLAAFTQATSALVSLLSGHNRKEEGILYPMCDQRLSEADIAQAITRISG